MTEPSRPSPTPEAATEERPGWSVPAPAACTAAIVLGLVDHLLGAGRATEAQALRRHLALAVIDPSCDGEETFPPGHAPADPGEAYFVLGSDLEAEAPDRALRCYRTALLIRPDHVAAYDRAARLHRLLDDPGSAAACFSRALRLDPSLREAAAAYAILLSGLGRHTDALSVLAQAGGERDDLIRFNEALLLFAHGRLEEALAKASALFFRQPGLQQVYGLLNQIFDRFGMAEEGATFSRPDFAVLARAYFERGAMDAAGSLLRALHGRTGATPATLLALAEWQLETSLYHQAEPYLAGIDLAALDPMQKVQFVSLLARLRLHQRNFAEAGRLLLPYRRMASQSWLVLLPWLDLCVATGAEPSPDELAALDRWSGLFAHHIHAGIHAARLLFAFGRIRQAVGLLDEMTARRRWTGDGGSMLASRQRFETFTKALAIAGAEQELDALAPRDREELFRTLDDTCIEAHRLRTSLHPGMARPARQASARPRDSRIAMTVLGRHGRFGNQIFQYAFLKLYARRHAVVAETPDWCGRYLFGADDPVATPDLPPFYDELLALQALEGEVPPVLNGRDINGFFMPHTARYAAWRDEFRALFRPAPAVAAPLAAALADLKGGDGRRTLVAVHIRRGDFGGDQFWAYPEHFYLSWLERLWPGLERPVLYVASDDPRVVGTFAAFSPVTARDLGRDIDGAPYFIDHSVMRTADVLAISNSTFSFSAAMLNPTGRLFLRPPAKDLPLVRFDPWNDRIIR